MKILKSLAAVLATGYILFCFSELLFWARPRPNDSLSGWVGTWLVYSLTGFVMLAIIDHFRARSPWALFLAGAVFGWLTEGLVVQTMYADLPLSLSFTGLAWHALISVLAGWGGLQQALHRGWKPAAALSATIGLVYGLWAIHWWVAPDGGISPVPAFALYTILATLLLGLAYWTVDRCLPRPFRPKRWLVLAVTGLLSLYFIFITVPASGWAALLLPVLLAVILVSMRHNQGGELAVNPVESPAGSVRNLLALLALPAVAIAVYGLAMALGLHWQTNWLLYALTTPAGFVMFLLSLGKIWRRVPTQETPNS